MRKIILLLLIFPFFYASVHSQEPKPYRNIDNTIFDGDDGLPLEVPSIKYGEATLNGYIKGLKGDNKPKGKIIISNPIIGEQNEVAFVGDTTGYFTVKVPLVSTTIVLISSGLFKEMLVLSPQQESSIYIDLEKRKERSLSYDKSYDETNYMFFSGVNANLNKQIHIYKINEYLEQEWSMKQLVQDVAMMNEVEQYKSYILNKYNLTKEEFSRKGLEGKIYYFAVLQAEMKCAELLLLGNYLLSDADKGGQRTSDKQTDNEPIFDDEFFSFLKNSHINHPSALYSNSYKNIINLCQYIGYALDKYKLRYRIRLVTAEMLQKLIDSGKLSADESAYIESIKGSFFDNWDADRIDNYKKQHLIYADRLLGTHKLRGKSLQLVKHLQGLCSDNEPNIRRINNVSINISIQILEEKLLSNNFLQQLNDSIFTKETLPPQYDNLFWRNLMIKYKDEIDFMQDEEYRNEQKEFVSRILGTEKGLLFDMLDLHYYGRKINRKIPLSEFEFKDIARKGNIYYTEYLIQENNKLMEEIKKNSKEYHIYKTDNLTNELVLSEIINSFTDDLLFITFWATWNETSTQTVKLEENVKASFSGKRITYIYLTDESSPLKTWESQIPYISGEHFRLKNKQFSYLKKTLNIDRLPAILILDKNRVQVYKKQEYNELEITTAISKHLKRKK